MARLVLPRGGGIFFPHDGGGDGGKGTQVGLPSPSFLLELGLEFDLIRIISFFILFNFFPTLDLHAR